MRFDWRLMYIIPLFSAWRRKWFFFCYVSECGHINELLLAFISMVILFPAIICFTVFRFLRSKKFSFIYSVCMCIEIVVFNLFIFCPNWVFSFDEKGFYAELGILLKRDMHKSHSVHTITKKSFSLNSVHNVARIWI